MQETGILASLEQIRVQSFQSKDFSSHCSSRYSYFLTFISLFARNGRIIIFYEVSLIDVAHSSTDSGARAGVIHTSHGDVPTPVFMPVGTQGTVKTIPWRDLEEFDVRMILSNTYHLYLRPGHELIARMGGLHKFIKWNRAILTDSGGFQVFSLADLREITDDGVLFQSHWDGSYHFFTPEKAIDVQWALRPDIMMAFDHCTSYPVEKSGVRCAVERTFQWARRCKRQMEMLLASDPEPSSAPKLFGIIQGGVFPDLRKISSEQIISLDFPGYAIGGLSVGEPKDQMFEMLSIVLPYLSKDVPRYLMGVGKPLDIIKAVSMGIDMFDCVIPTRNARNASVYTWKGKVSLKSAYHAEDDLPIDPCCQCYVCKNYSRAYIRHLFVSGELLAPYLATYHSLFFFAEFMRKMRQAIIEDKFLEFARDFENNFEESPIQ